MGETMWSSFWGPIICIKQVGCTQIHAHTAHRYMHILHTDTCTYCTSHRYMHILHTDTCTYSTSHRYMPILHTDTCTYCTQIHAHTAHRYMHTPHTDTCTYLTQILYMHILHTFTLDPSHTCVAPEHSLKLSTTNYRDVSSASANAGGTLREGSDMQYVNLSNYSTLSILERLHLDSQT